MVANDDAHSLAQRGALRFIASKLRSYGGLRRFTFLIYAAPSLAEGLQ